MHCLPEAQRTQAIESVTWVISLCKGNETAKANGKRLQESTVSGAAADGVGANNNRMVCTCSLSVVLLVWQFCLIGFGKWQIYVMTNEWPSWHVLHLGSPCQCSCCLVFQYCLSGDRLTNDWLIWFGLGNCRFSFDCKQQAIMAWSEDGSFPQGNHCLTLGIYSKTDLDHHHICI